jgi:hypothetical protein
MIVASKGKKSKSKRKYNTRFLVKLFLCFLLQVLTAVKIFSDMGKGGVVSIIWVRGCGCGVVGSLNFERVTITSFTIVTGDRTGTLLSS